MRAIIILAVILFFLIGCAPPNAPAGEAEEPKEETEMNQNEGNNSEPETQVAEPAEVDLSKITPEPPGTGQPIEAPRPGVPNPFTALVHEVSLDLAGRLNVDISDVTFLSSEEVDWRDSSLGCPQPGFAYLTVITPGYKIILAAGGQEYAYHTDLRGRFVLCEGSG